MLEGPAPSPTIGDVITLFNGEGVDTEGHTYKYAGVTFASDPFGSVPEPATIVIWSLLGAIAVTFGWRRRKQAA